MQAFDRAAEDLGNVVHLEHVNVTIPDQRLATLFYVSGLGLTRDPYLNVSDDNMWINVGRSQFHLPTGKPQKLRGRTAIVMPGRDALLERLAGVRQRLDGTAFNFAEHNDYVAATCPWGNSYRCYEPDSERFGRISLGFPYVEFDVPMNAAAGIAAFYRDFLDTPAEVMNDDGPVAKITVGKDQYLLFRETDAPLPDYDNHHVQVYVVNFSGPYRKLMAKNLVSQEDNRYQYRFRDIPDASTGKPLFTIEHEVRSINHPNYLRPLINRNPAQTTRTYSQGYDQANWALPPVTMDSRPPEGM